MASNSSDTSARAGRHGVVLTGRGQRLLVSPGPVGWLSGWRLHSGQQCVGALAPHHRIGTEHHRTHSSPTLADAKPYLIAHPGFPSCHLPIPPFLPLPSIRLSFFPSSSFQVYKILIHPDLTLSSRYFNHFLQLCHPVINS